MYSIRRMSDQHPDKIWSPRQAFKAIGIRTLQLVFGSSLWLSTFVQAAGQIPVQNEGAGVSGSYEILVIPVEFDNWKHDKPIADDNPYHAPVTIAALDTLYNSKAKQYYHDTSRGKIQLNFHVYDQWINMGQMEKYAGSSSAPTSLLSGAINAYNRERDGQWQHESDYDKTVIVFSGPSWADEWAEEWQGTGWDPDTDFIHPIAFLAGDNGKANCISAHDGIGVISHELGHAILNIKDKNKASRIPAYRYQLVGAGAWNGVDPADPTAHQSDDAMKNTIPVLISPWNRVNMGWEAQPLDLAAGNQTSMIRLAPATNVSAVTNPQSGQRNLITVNAGNGKYYILENRQADSWDIALPDWGLLIWSINDNWRSNPNRDAGYGSGIWEDVIDTHPETVDQPSDYKYYYIDHRTRAFNPFTDYDSDTQRNPLGLYDATLKVGESFRLPGSNVVVKVSSSSLEQGMMIELNNVDQAIFDGEPCRDCTPPNNAPVADFTYVADLLAVQFDNQSVDIDGQVVANQWDFGDGNSSTNADPVHIYAEKGTYSVILTVTDDDGGVHSITQSVMVSDQVIDQSQLQNGVAKIGIASTSKYQLLHYYIDVPAGTSSLIITTSGNNGDADLYVAYEREASRDDYDKRSAGSSSNETVSYDNPPAGRYQVAIRTWREYDGLSLTAEYPVPMPIDELYQATSQIDIPDNDMTGITSVINVDSSVVATKVQVAVDITHTYKGDLTVILIAPTGEQWVLHDQTGGSADDINLVRELPLAMLDKSGDWRLVVVDSASKDTGTLKGWQLGFSGI